MKQFENLDTVDQLNAEYVQKAYESIFNFNEIEDSKTREIVSALLTVAFVIASK